MTQQPQQASARAAAVHAEWTQLVNAAFAELNGGHLPPPSDIQKLEKLVRWGLHIPHPATGPTPVEEDKGASLAGKLMQMGHAFMDKLQAQAPATAVPVRPLPTARTVAPALQAATPAVRPDEARLARERQARDPKTAPDILHQLAKEGDSGVRLALANNLQAPAVLLELLSADADRMVKAAVAVHAYTPAPVLALLAASTDKLLKLRVAQNPQAPPELLSTLSEEQESKIVQAVIENPRTPDNVLEHLQHAQDEFVRLRAREAREKRQHVEKEIKLHDGR